MKKKDTLKKRLISFSYGNKYYEFKNDLRNYLKMIADLEESETFLNMLLTSLRIDDSLENPSKDLAEVFIPGFKSIKKRQLKAYESIIDDTLKKIKKLGARSEYQKLKPKIKVENVVENYLKQKRLWKKFNSNQASEIQLSPLSKEIYEFNSDHSYEVYRQTLMRMRDKKT